MTWPVISKTCSQSPTVGIETPSGAARWVLGSSWIASTGNVNEEGEEGLEKQNRASVRDLDSGAAQTVAWDEIRRRLRNRSNLMRRSVRFHPAALRNAGEAA